MSQENYYLIGFFFAFLSPFDYITGGKQDLF
jgi:hypothetical protein